MHITSNFDGGNITVAEYRDDGTALLKIDRDGKAEFRQWFSFRCVSVPGERHLLQFVNAGACNMPKSWRGYRAVASYDRRRWSTGPSRSRHRLQLRGRYFSVPVVDARTTLQGHRRSLQR